VPERRISAIMGQILHQLSELALGSVPTIILFLLLLAAYGVLVRRPLDRVLAERAARTTGAVEQARGAMSAAEAETAVFEGKLRAARAQINAAREARLKQWAQEREQVLAQARAATAEKIQGARLGIEQSAFAARQQIETMGGELSAQILKAVLPADAAGSEFAR